MLKMEENERNQEKEWSRKEKVFISNKFQKILEKIKYLRRPNI
jgi:hypothetical protein